MDRLEEGLSVTEVASQALPKSLRQKFSSLTNALSHGVETVKGLLDSNDVEEAVREGRKLLSRFEKENPLRVLLERAKRSFPQVLTAAVQPLPFVGSIVNVAATVKEQVYDRWKARILHQPFEPADLPVERVDANTGYTLLTGTPVMKEAFRPELEANDRPFLEDTAEELLSTGDLESLWDSYSDRFSSRKEFDQGVAALRRSAADLQLKEEIDPSLLEVSGGYDEIVSAADALHTDKSSQADLDAIVTVVDALRSADSVETPLRHLFDQVKSQIESANRPAG